MIWNPMKRNMKWGLLVNQLQIIALNLFFLFFSNIWSQGTYISVTVLSNEKMGKCLNQDPVYTWSEGWLLINIIEHASVSSIICVCGCVCVCETSKQNLVSNSGFHMQKHPLIMINYNIQSFATRVLHF